MEDLWELYSKHNSCLTTLALGCTHGCWVVYAGIWLKTEVVGPTHWCWITHAGVKLYTWVLGCTRWRLAQNGGVGPYTLALSLRHRCWSYMLTFGPKCRYWITHAGFGPYIVVLGCTLRHFLGQGRNDNVGEQRSEMHQIRALVPPSPTTVWCWGCTKFQMSLFMTGVFRLFLVS